MEAIQLDLVAGMVGPCGEARGGPLPQHDVLVVGGGFAGLRAALSARDAGSDVAVLSKVHPMRSHSSGAHSGINAALKSGDSWEAHAKDTIAAGGGPIGPECGGGDVRERCGGRSGVGAHGGYLQSRRRGSNRRYYFPGFLTGPDVLRWRLGGARDIAGALRADSAVGDSHLRRMVRRGAAGGRWDVQGRDCA